MQVFNQLIEVAPILGAAILLAALAIQSVSANMQAKPVKIRRDCCRRSR